MRFLLDENVSFRVAPFLFSEGHDVVHVEDVGLDGVDDAIIFAAAQEEDRVVVTSDHDFVQLLFASGGTRPSLILTREVDILSSEQLAKLVLAALSPELEEYLVSGAIATITPDRVRVRPLPLRK